MKGQNLSMLEKQQLVDSYQSDIKKLQFQISLLKDAVTELKEGIRLDRASAPAVESAAAPATPAKKATARKPRTTKGRGRPKKTSKAAAAPAAETADVKEAPAAKKAAPAKATARKSAAKTTRAKKAAAPKAEKPATPAKRGRKPNQKLGGYRLSDWDQMIVDGIKDAGKALIKTELLDLAAKKNAAENLKMDEQAINVKISQSLHKLANRRDDLVKVAFPGRGFAYALAEWKTAKGDLPKKYLR